MDTAEIRQRWLDYFGSRGHTVVPSASLIADDPSLLFTVAGMVPFIPYLTGVVPAPWPRATDCQKCIRTNDIEEVGKTVRHGTFFQMLGNWSFGDYFKRGAISYAWELLTSSEAEGGLGFDERDLWVTVYEDDDEAAALWREIAGLPAERIQRFGREDNYWSTGQPGPAGPCSEIYFDRGPAYGPEGGPAVDDTRYVEIWNLVFMQYRIDNVTSKTEFDIVGELPHKNIDTGMGLERVAFIKQGVESMYEIDQVRPVLDLASELSGVRYGADHGDDVRLRVVADHVRSALMLIGDGVSPSNDGRGYVLRRLIRRAVRAMRLLGVQEPVLPELLPASKNAMSPVYPELAENFDRISRIAYAEEATFLRTLASGTTILDLAIDRAKQQHSSALSGATAFSLHDTYGFPIDLTLEIAAENGLDVNRDEFASLMADQRSRAQADAKAKKTGNVSLDVYRQFREAGETAFDGYEELEAEGRVLGIVSDGVSIPQASVGQTVELILTETTFYAESGGQAADRGRITGPGFEAELIDAQKPVKGLVAHTVRITAGSVAVDDAVTTHVDAERRLESAQAHSATHLVHAALRQLLGSTAVQSGSFNRPGYLRLDFAWNDRVSAETLSEIDEVSNIAVRNDLPVTARQMPLDQARASGAMALFGEKYGDVVRVIQIGGPWSRELCAGTHVEHSSQVGLVSVLSESSVGSGARRIEALVGLDAVSHARSQARLIADLASDLKTKPDQLRRRVADLSAQLHESERRVAQLRSEQRKALVPRLLASARTVGLVQLVAANLGKASSGDEVRELAGELRQGFGISAAVVALAAEVAGKPLVVVATTQAARDAGVAAGPLAKMAASELGGGGGGRPDLAQGGGTDASAIGRALELVEQGLRG